LPGGVSAASVEAAEFLLRSGAQVFIDGYNVAMLAWPGRPLCDQRESLIVAAENAARRFGASLTIVFDGADVVGGFAPTRRVVRIVFSPEGVTADDVIRSEVGRVDPSDPVVVVTNDAEIVRDVKAVGANVISSTTFTGLL
jgi:predicted RNA-binding protein with PIN domain